MNRLLYLISYIKAQITIWCSNACKTQNNRKISISSESFKFSNPNNRGFSMSQNSKVQLKWHTKNFAKSLIFQQTQKKLTYTQHSSTAPVIQPGLESEGKQLLAFPHFSMALYMLSTLYK